MCMPVLIRRPAVVVACLPWIAATAAHFWGLWGQPGGLGSLLLLASVVALAITVAVVARSATLTIIRAPMLLALFPLHALALIWDALPDAAPTLGVLILWILAARMPDWAWMPIQARVWGYVDRDMLDTWCRDQGDLWQAFAEQADVTHTPGTPFTVYATLAPAGPFSGPILIDLALRYTHNTHNTLRADANPTTQRIEADLLRRVRGWVGGRALMKMQVGFDFTPTTSAHARLAKAAQANKGPVWPTPQKAGISPAGLSTLITGLLVCVATLWVNVALTPTPKPPLDPARLDTPHFQALEGTPHPLPLAVARRFHEGATAGALYPAQTEDRRMVVCITTPVGTYTYAGLYRPGSPELHPLATPTAERLFAQNPCAQRAPT